jgi:hypothetical protein
MQYHIGTKVQYHYTALRQSDSVRPQSETNQNLIGEAPPNLSSVGLKTAGFEPRGIKKMV